MFAITITGYKYWVRHQNKHLEAGGERAERTMRYGVTQEQLNMGWRYEGY